MRLIDADELKAKMFDIPKPKEGVTFWDGVDTVGDLIDNAQTVEQEVYMNSKDFERPKAKWIEKEDTPASVSYYCSNCEMEGIPVTPFCPWCGAEMQKGDKNEEKRY